MVIDGMNFCRDATLRAAVVIVTGTAIVIPCAGCTGGGPRPKAASVDAPRSSSSVTPVPSTTMASSDLRRHRVGETEEEWRAVVEPWNRCMKEHSADVDTQPHNITDADRWMVEHSAAVDACKPVAPLPPWGEDPANPEYRDNIHQWVKCMNDRGLKTIETPDDEEQPWTYAGTSGLAPAQQSRIEHECEMETIGQFDR
jgi:hypothetical protein